MRFVSVVTALSLASTANAALIVTNATVRHVFSGLPQFGSSSTPLVNASPGNHFDTYDGKAGATLDIKQTDGMLGVSTWGINNQPYGFGYSNLTCSGSIRFTAIDGDFSLTPLVGGNYTTVNFTLTQLASGLGRQMTTSGVQATSSGPLTFPASPGEYTLIWNSSHGFFAGTTFPGQGRLQFAITPEPTLLGLAGFALLARRRR